MKKYFISKLLILIPTLLGITLIAFILGVISPGNPAEIALSQGGNVPTTEQIKFMEKQLGLDKPIYVQYVNWLKKASKGDFSESYVTRRDISKEIKRRFPITLTIAFNSILTTIIVGLTFGVICAWNSNKKIDGIISFILNVFLSFPEFWIALLLILVFSERLKILPSSGLGTFKNMILPTISLSLIPSSTVAKLMRGSLIKEFGKTYYTVLYTRGLSKSTMILKNAFINALVPIIPTLGNYIGGLLGGTIVVETIFSIPGLGTFLIEAVQSNDYPAISAYVLMTGFIYVVINVLIDIFGVIIAPKSRLGE